MSDSLIRMYGWVPLIAFTIISVFRIVRWLAPYNHRGAFLKYVPYSRNKLCLVIISIMAFVGYIVVIGLNASTSLTEKILCDAMVGTLVLAILLSDKEYELGTLTAFGFKTKNND